MPIGPLDLSKHDRKSFDCGVEALNQYLAKYASQDIERKLARIFVLENECTPTQIEGYYTLSNYSFKKESLDHKVARHLPHYPVPAVLIGRLAVAKLSHGKGLGEMLLMDTFSKILQASRALGIHSILVDAKDEKAASFYKRYGFIQALDRPQTLLLPITTLEKVF